MVSCDWFKDLAEWKKVLIVFVGVGIFVAFFLIGFSVTVLEPLEYGLEFDENSVSVNTDKLFSSGRHFQGLGYSFLEFPRTQQLIIFSDSLKKTQKSRKFKESAQMQSTLPARTQEGLKIQVDLIIGYQLTTSNDDSARVSQLWNIYQNFGDEWKNFIVLLTNAAIKDTLQGYQALQIPQSRLQIGDALFANLKSKLNDYHFTLNMANIININFPENLNKAITQTEIVNQEKQTTEFKKQVKQIEKQTQILLAKNQTQIITSNANTTSLVDFSQKTAQSQIITQSLVDYAASINNIITELGFNAAETLEFLWIYGMKYNQANSVHVSTGIKD